jgi:energy-coupling factor transport system permease protein
VDGTGALHPAGRPLHPVAWWCWALGLATAASRTTNLLLLGLVVAVALSVVLIRRTDAPWALGLRAYLVLAAVVVVVRLLFRALLGADAGPTVLVTLPRVPLPDVAAGIRLGGPVSLEGLVASLQDGVRLAALLLCVGAANLLADPKRLLAHLPAALSEVGTTVVVALTVAPQLVEAAGRVRRARRLRGGTATGLRSLRAILLPVLEDALDRSIALAAAMDSRGYGRAADVPAPHRRRTRALLVAGLCGLCVGVYGLLDGSAPDALGTPALLAGTALAVGGLRAAGRGVRRTRYRPDPWRAAEWLVAGTGLAAAALTVLAGRVQPDLLLPPAQPLAWPVLPALAAAGVLLALVPAAVRPRARAARA